MRIGWIGFHVEGLDALQSVLEAGHAIEAVLTLTPAEADKRSGGADYRPLCAAHGLPVHEVRHINDASSVALLRELSLDIVFVIGWSQIVGPEALGSARVGMIGAHASLLPHNRGSAPVNWAIIRGESVSGNTLLWLAPGVDDGDIIDARSIDISQYDTCASIYEKVAATNTRMILDLIPKLQAGDLPRRPQPAGDATILPRRRPQDGLIDWSASGMETYNFVRGLTRPYPGAFSCLDGEKWTIWQAAWSPLTANPDTGPGEVLGAVVSPVEAACGQAVACGEGAVTLLEIESSDGRILCGRELAEQNWQGRVWEND